MKHSWNTWWSGKGSCSDSNSVSLHWKVAPCKVEKPVQPETSSKKNFCASKTHPRKSWKNGSHRKLISLWRRERFLVEVSRHLQRSVFAVHNHIGSTMVEKEREEVVGQNHFERKRKSKIGFYQDGSYPREDGPCWGKNEISFEQLNMGTRVPLRW